MVRLPGPAKRFTAQVGVDNNHDTGGVRGSVFFMVEVNNEPTFQSSLLHGGDRPATVDVPLDDAMEFTLRVSHGGDGSAFDQADWCDPVVTLTDGTQILLNKLPVANVKEEGDERRSPTLREKSAPGICLETWSLSTDDTKLGVGATDKGQLCICELGSTRAQKNWAASPSVFSLTGRAFVDGTSYPLKWEYMRGDLATQDGQKLTIRFACKQPPLELESIWQSRPGPGPVRHSMFIHNKSPQPLTLDWQPTLDIDLAGPANRAQPFALWTFHSDGGAPDAVGIYRDPIVPGFAGHIDTSRDGAFLPYAVIDGDDQGVYVGVEWGFCQIAAQALAKGGEGRAPGVRIAAGTPIGSRISLEPQATFDVPPGFVGAYRGDVDDAGNRLRKYLFNYCIPDVVREDPSYPKVQWNAFAATADKWGSWNCVERKFYPRIDDIAPLGFEEVMIGVGWWKGETFAEEPVSDPVDWPSGMAKAAEYAHKAGLRFGLYWNRGEDMATVAGRERRFEQVRRLYSEYGADMWRSDATGGPVVDDSYESFKGFYEMLDRMAVEIPNFQWENCCCGGRIKDFGAMQRCVKIFQSDAGQPLDVRLDFYDTSYALHPIQLMGCLGGVRPRGAAEMKIAFRSMSLGAPEWFLDAPNGSGGWGAWDQAEKDAVKDAVATYKTRIRPLVRNADLYHIFPRPDGTHWDGIQYYDPTTAKGVVYIFKPAPGETTQRIKLRGVDPETVYRVTFEDGTNPEREKSGKALIVGIDVTLTNAPVSELMFLERAM